MPRSYRNGDGGALSCPAGHAGDAMRWWLVALAGCAEQWVAADTLEEPFTGPGEFGIRVTTEPEAWPDEVVDDAVRARFDGPGTLSSLEDEREILETSSTEVNVLDAFDDCPRDEVCVRELWFSVACEEPCDGEVTADAFLAAKGLLDGGDTAWGGPLTLEWVAPSP